MTFLHILVSRFCSSFEPRSHIAASCPFEPDYAVPSIVQTWLLTHCTLLHNSNSSKWVIQQTKSFPANFTIELHLKAKNNFRLLLQNPTSKHFPNWNGVHCPFRDDYRRILRLSSKSPACKMSTFELPTHHHLIPRRLLPNCLHISKAVVSQPFNPFMPPFHDVICNRSANGSVHIHEAAYRWLVVLPLLNDHGAQWFSSYVNQKNVFTSNKELTCYESPSAMRTFICSPVLWISSRNQHQL